MVGMLCQLKNFQNRGLWLGKTIKVTKIFEAAGEKHFKPTYYYKILNLKKQIPLRLPKHSPLIHAGQWYLHWRVVYPAVHLKRDNSWTCANQKLQPFQKAHIFIRQSIIVLSHASMTVTVTWKSDPFMNPNSRQYFNHWEGCFSAGPKCLCLTLLLLVHTVETGATLWNETPAQNLNEAAAAAAASNV